MSLLDKLPIELLFDSNESHLNEIKFNHGWIECNYLTQYINQFETEYLNIQHKLEQQGKLMRKLACVKHSNVTQFNGPSCILAEHLHMNSRGLQIDLNKSMMTPQYNPCLRKLTCEYDIQFDNKNKNVQQEKGTNNSYSEIMNVETLRIKHFSERSSFDIFSDKTVIETLNLQNSLKNLLLNIEFLCVLKKKCSK